MQVSRARRLSVQSTTPATSTRLGTPSQPAPPSPAFVEDLPSGYGRCVGEGGGPISYVNAR